MRYDPVNKILWHNVDGKEVKASLAPEWSRFRRFGLKENFDTLKFFYLINEGFTKITSETVDAEVARKWLDSNKPVFVIVTSNGHRECKRLVRQIEKISDEIVVTTIYGEIYHLNKIA